MNEPPARVILRPIGSPLTIGMSGLLIASLVNAGLDLGWIGVRETSEVGLILIAAPFLLQFVASVFSYLARDGAVGAALGVLATTWLALGLVDIVSAAGAVSAAVGLLLLGAGSVLALSSVAVGSVKPLPALVFLIAAARFVLAALYELTAVDAWRHAAGVAGLVIIALAAYCVLAFELEGIAHQPVLPTFRRPLPPAPPERPDQFEIGALMREPGVRQSP